MRINGLWIDGMLIVLICNESFDWRLVVRFWIDRNFFGIMNSLFNYYKD